MGGGLTTSVLADNKVDFKPDDTTVTVLMRQQGQRVEVLLKSLSAKQHS